MENGELIRAEEFCNHHNIATSFISALQDYHLIDVTIIEDSTYLPFEQLSKVEQLMRMHFDLQINMEGLDAISHMLDRVRSMQNELTILRSRLRIYEDI